MNRSSKTKGVRCGGSLRGQHGTGYARHLHGDNGASGLVARVGRAQARRTQPHSLLTGRAHAQPARVLMTADCVGGVWTYALDLARGLCAGGVEVILATMGDLPTPTQWQEAHAISDLTLCASGYKLEWMPDPWRDLEQAGAWLLALEAQFAPDVIHLNGYAHASCAWKAPVLVVAHSCVLSWWQAVKSEPVPPDWHMYRDVMTRGLQAAHTVVAPTQAMLTAAAHYYGPLRSSQVIANGRDPALYQPAAKEPFILTAGRLWDEAKNVDALRQAARHVAWPVYAAGCAGTEAQADGDTPTLRDDADFRPLGRLASTELADWYARAAIYALPARYEPFGLSALEAALSGCALILGDIASLREVWGDAALFVPPDDISALCRALNRLISTPDLRRDMAERARTRAQQYTVHTMTRAYLDCYGALLSLACPRHFVHEAATLPPLDYIDPIDDDEIAYREYRQTQADALLQTDMTDEPDTFDPEEAQA